VVAFASDKRLDSTFSGINEKPQFFNARPVAVKAAPNSSVEYVRARWWPGEAPRDEDQKNR